MFSYGHPVDSESFFWKDYSPLQCQLCDKRKSTCSPLQCQLCDKRKSTYVWVLLLESVLSHCIICLSLHLFYTFSIIVTSISLEPSLVTQMVKNLPAMWETWIWSLGWEDPLEKTMTTHFSILAWRTVMDKGAWWASICLVTKSLTWLSD